jgi:DNA-binding transcriptional regulator YiaG
MSNHPNRSRNSPAANPTPGEIRAAREAAGLSQIAAASTIFCSLGAWQKWELGIRKMHPAFWALFKIRMAARMGAEKINPSRSQSP